MQCILSRRKEKINLSEKVTNEEFIESIGERNNILPRKANWFDHILKRNCLLHNAIEGQMLEVKGVGRRRLQLLDDFGNRRR